MGFSLTLIGNTNLEGKLVVFPFQYQWVLYGTAVAVIGAFAIDSW